MKAVILAAGVASRLRPLTDSRPKCLLKVGEKSILQLTIDNLLANGFYDIIIVTGYLQEKIKEFVASQYPDLNVTYLYNEIYDSTNNIYSLWMVKEALSGEDLLLLDSDIVFDRDIIKLIVDSEYENCLALRSTHKLGKEEIKVLADKSNNITQISKVVDPALAIGESIGIEKFSGKVLNDLFEDLDDMILRQKKVNVWYEASFQNIIDAGAKIKAIDVGSLACMEIDTLEDLDIAAREVVKKIRV